MSKRALTVSVLTAGLSAGLLAGALSPAAAQGNPVAGSGNVYYLSGAGNTSGQAQKVMVFGDPSDEVYFGDWDGDGVDTPMIRRGFGFHVADKDGKTVNVFGYGDAGDEVLVGDWDGDGVDSLAVRRGNKFFVKNDNQKSGKADKEFYYGDAGDTVLVGDWDNDDKDTLIVRRGATYHVKNDTESGKAEYTFVFGEANDTILVGDWSNAAESKSGDGADQLAVRRGFEYHLSSELGSGPLKTDRVFGYGNPDDNVFVVSLPTDMVDENGDPIIDEVREATYYEDKAATYEAGETIINWVDGKPVKDPVTGKPVTAKGGEEKVFVTGDRVTYRGGEPRVDAAGTELTYAADGTEIIHHKDDLVVLEDGSYKRGEDGKPMTWGQLDADNKNYPDVDLAGKSNKYSVKKGWTQVHREGELRVRVDGELATYVDVPAAVAGNFGPRAGDTVLTQSTADYKLDKDGEVVFTTPTPPALPAPEYVAADKYAADRAKAGDAVVARAGQVMPTWRYVSAAVDTQYGVAKTAQADADAAAATAVEKAAAWEAERVKASPNPTVKADADAAAKDAEDKATAARAEWAKLQDLEVSDAANFAWAPVAAGMDDEDRYTYTAKSVDAKKVADLDADKKSDPIYFKGGEQLTYVGGELLPAYKGGESVMEHLKGEVILDEDGDPTYEGTGEPLQITGDGLGVRRNFG
ncbi:hypothetical protein [Geodermatophilus sp. SYSU D00079]